MERVGMSLHRFGSVTVALDVIGGYGLLARPSHAADVLDPFCGDGRGVLETDLSNALVWCGDNGIEPGYDENTDDFVYDRDLPDGRHVFGLFAAEALHDFVPPWEEFAEVVRALRCELGEG